MSSTLPDIPEKETDTGFVRKPMVKWMSPGELVRAGIKALLSSLFGAYADWREVQALRADVSSRKLQGKEMKDEARDHHVALSEVYDLSHRDEVYFDYVADLGDGFNATYTVARALAEEGLDIGGEKTRRGDVLIMGGDQVYPTATREEYKNRMEGPYRSALPFVKDETKAPALFAIPGNHDWYDGLTSFMRLFCQDRWIGGWKTRQKRSYFAIRLPGNWWIWGIDVQLASDIDLPQMNYFRSIAEQSAEKEGPCNIILCTAEPTWVFTDDDGEEAYKNLEYFEKNTITGYGHTLKVGLAGDLHTYARYEMEGTGKQRFIAGGGGAYLYPSHQLPESFKTPAYDWKNRKVVSEHYTLKKNPETGKKSLFPYTADSQKLTMGALKMAWLNKGFSLLFGAIYVIFAWLLQGSSKYAGHEHTGTGGLMENTMLWELSYAANGWEVFWYVINLFPHNIAAIILGLVLLAGLTGFAHHQRTVVKVLMGLTHTLLHLILIVSLMWAFSQLNIRALGLAVEAPLQILLFFIEMLLIGGFLAGTLFGIYLLLANFLIPKKNGKKGVHANEVLACQPNPHFKHFLRLKVDKEGTLTIYPTGIRKVYTRWKFQKPADKYQPHYAADKPVNDMVMAIEKPVVIGNLKLMKK
ncbi:metallophosphoesterase [Roseivirga sp. BDSF3-8]|uniref:metallophosphoesterase n=1 Tax=Roseivirga sp. BDSF3-8 TaxID=3241598 RepID=UPI0035326845